MVCFGLRHSSWVYKSDISFRRIELNCLFSNHFDWRTCFKYLQSLQALIIDITLGIWNSMCRRNSSVTIILWNGMRIVSAFKLSTYSLWSLQHDKADVITLFLKCSECGNCLAFVHLADASKVVNHLPLCRTMHIWMNPNTFPSYVQEWNNFLFRNIKIANRTIVANESNAVE